MSDARETSFARELGSTGEATYSDIWNIFQNSNFTILLVYNCIVGVLSLFHLYNDIALWINER